MRSGDQGQGSVFSDRSLEDRVPKDPPLRPLRAMVDLALEEVSPGFAELSARAGRPSIAPERLLEGDVARGFFDAVLAPAAEGRLLSSEHFSVDGTLMEAWASHKSSGPRPRGVRTAGRSAGTEEL